MQNATLSGKIEEVCREHRAQTAMYEANGTPVTFQSFFLTLLAFAEVLEDRGVREGQLAACTIDDPIAGLALRLALLRLGAHVIATSRSVAEGTMGLQVDWQLIRHGQSPQDSVDLVVEPGWLRSPTRVVAVSRQGVLVKSSSGTTGLPKLRMMGDAGILARLTRSREQRGAIKGPALIAFRPNSSPGMNSMLRSLLRGESQIYPQETPVQTLQEMEARAVVKAYFAPFNFEQTLEAAQSSGLRPSALRQIYIGGGAVSPSLAAQGEAIFGCDVFNSYGSSETGSISHYRPALTPDLSGVVGRIYSDFGVKFMGPNAVESDPQTGGELWLKLPKAVQVTTYPTGAPICDADGWLGTGDIGHLTADGNFCLTGRLAEFLNVGGNKRAPSRFETLVQAFPNLRRVVAYRAPSGTGMDHVGLAVVPDTGFDLDQFKTFVTATFGPLYPTHIRVMDQIPATQAGKVDRARLTAEFTQNSTR